MGKYLQCLKYIKVRDLKPIKVHENTIVFLDKLKMISAATDFKVMVAYGEIIN